MINSFFFQNKFKVEDKQRKEEEYYKDIFSLKSAEK